MKPEPIALVCADIHLRHTAPPAREGEKNWYEAMHRPLRQLYMLKAKYGVPLICAGDVFDKWNPPSELISFALDALPDMIAIPGQHDLPYHRLEDMGITAFGILHKAGRITYIEPGQTHLIRGHLYDTAPWGCKIRKPNQKRKEGQLNIAIVHAYIWREGANFPDAPSDSYVSNYDARLQGYNVAVFGDNHKSFDYKRPSGCLVYNNGGFMKIKSDEHKHRPSVGLIYSDGHVERIYLDTSEDSFVPVTKENEVLAENTQLLSDFMRNLRTLKSSTISYRDAVEQYMKTYEVTKGAKRILLDSMELL